ncbi:MAG: hypothetical protein ACREHG_04375 [Candidatus Saccharimonadales bacterium]
MDFDDVQQHYVEYLEDLLQAHHIEYEPDEVIAAVNDALGNGYENDDRYMIDYIFYARDYPDKAEDFGEKIYEDPEKFDKWIMESDEFVWYN